MEEAGLDVELERIYKKFLFLWKEHDFHIMYLTRDYGMYYRGFILGLGNDVCKLVFERETSSPLESIAVTIGTKKSPFAPKKFSYFVKDGWYPLDGLIYWLSGVECERDDNVDKDLENVGHYLKLHMDKVVDLYKSPADFNNKLEYYRNLYKEDQLTVDKIRRERARLQALGQDSSLEAAIASLRGGKK